MPDPQQSSALDILATVIGSGAVAAVISGIFGWKTKRSVEEFKTGLNRGLHVSKAQYDLELDSFKNLWKCLSGLQLKVREFLAPDRFHLKTQEGENLDWYIKSFPDVAQDFLRAHDEVMHAVLNAAPFYPNEIKHAAKKVLEIDMAVVRRISDIDDTQFSATWFDELRTLSNSIDREVLQVEELIRSRLESLRVIS